MTARLKETIESIIGEIKRIASTESVIGQPINVADKMIIPVSRIMVGFGAGGGEGETDPKKSGYMGGGAGGARIDPIGFIVIYNDTIQFLPVKQGKFENIIDAIPGIVEKFRKKKDGGGAEN